MLELKIVRLVPCMISAKTSFLSFFTKVEYVLCLQSITAFTNDFDSHHIFLNAKWIIYSILFSFFFFLLTHSCAIVTIFDENPVKLCKQCGTPEKLLSIPAEREQLSTWAALLTAAMAEQRGGAKNLTPKISRPFKDIRITIPSIKLHSLSPL